MAKMVKKFNREIRNLDIAAGKPLPLDVNRWWELVLLVFASRCIISWHPAELKAGSRDKAVF
jgi:hypothetical protein